MHRLSAITVGIGGNGESVGSHGPSRNVRQHLLPALSTGGGCGCCNSGGGGGGWQSLLTAAAAAGSSAGTDGPELPNYTVHQLPSNARVYRFAHDQPIGKRISSGDVVEVQTLDGDTAANVSSCPIGSRASDNLVDMHRLLAFLTTWLHAQHPTAGLAPWATRQRRHTMPSGATTQT